MSELEVNRLLAQMGAMAAQAAGQPQVDPGAAAPEEFASLLKGALDAVNKTQSEAGALAESFEAGQPVDLAEVMIALQKASISFEAMTQVRNRLVSAYQEIMAMQI